MSAQAVAVSQASETDFRALLRIHLAAPSESTPSGEAGHLAAAAFAGYLDLDSVRHDFPLVLCAGDTAGLARPLAHLVDDLVRAGGDQDRGRRQALLFRVEREIKAQASTCSYGQLAEMWARAVERVLEAEPQGEARDQAATLLRAARAKLVTDGQVIGCGADTARKLFAHAWDRLQAEQAERENMSLGKLVGALEDILAADKALSPQAISADALSASLGDDHAGGIDFDALSSVLRASKHQRPLPASRRRRVRQVIKVLNDELALLERGAGNGTKRRSTRRLVTTCGSCEEALSLFQAEIYRMVALLRAVRIARLEIDNRYREERHDAFFESFGPDHLTAEERRALPPVLVYLDGDAMRATDQAALLEILAAELPIKVLLEVTRVPAGTLPASGPTAVGGWLERFAGMAVTLEQTFVMQSACSHLPAMCDEVADGLNFAGPALFAVYTGPREPREDLPAYLLTAAAVESRAFPCLVSNPARGPRWADRFLLDHNPEPESAWPRHRVEFEARDGSAAGEDVSFTMIDYLACDPRFAGHFVPVSSAAWHPEMVPAATYLGLSAEAAAGKVPYVLMIDGAGGLRRVVVRRAPIAAARRCQARWRSLQELAGIDNSHVERALAHERERLEAQMEAQLEARREQAGGDASAEAAGEPVVETAAPVEVPAEVPAADAGHDPDHAWIDTAMCTACNDCVDRNNLMFGYNETKQAFVRDPAAGTYREMIEAAENCPVCIIHPGKPLNPDEPGLDDLVARAAAL